MRAGNVPMTALDEADLPQALGCSSAAVAAMQNDGVLESQGELWELGPAREYLRDAAWADNLWR